jgi:hypothetical protein
MWLRNEGPGNTGKHRPIRNFFYCETSGPGQRFGREQCGGDKRVAPQLGMRIAPACCALLVSSSRLNLGPPPTPLPLRTPL